MRKDSNHVRGAHARIDESSFDSASSFQEDAVGQQGYSHNAYGNNYGAPTGQQNYPNSAYGNNYGGVPGQQGYASDAYGNNFSAPVSQQGNPSNTYGNNYGASVNQQNYPAGYGNNYAGSPQNFAPINGQSGSTQSFASVGGVGGAGGFGGSGGHGSPSPQMQPKKKSKGWRAVFIIALIVLICSLAVLGAILYQYWAQQKAYSDLESNVSLPADTNANVSLSDLKVDWDALKAINPDVVAWVYIPGTPVNYPVVQGKDNDEYLKKSFDGSTGWTSSAGTIFLDSNNKSDLSSRNNALYGHNMNDGSMFASLAKWENQDEFNSHRDIYVLTPKGNYRLKSFAVVVTTGSDAIVQTSFASNTDFTNYVEDKLQRSVVSQTGDVLSASDIKQTFLFSTCEYTKSDGRAVAFASVVETTVKDNPYVSSVSNGSTDLSKDESDSVADQYREAA